MMVVNFPKVNNSAPSFSLTILQDPSQLKGQQIDKAQERKLGQHRTPILGGGSCASCDFPCPCNKALALLGRETSGASTPATT